MRSILFPVALVALAAVVVGKAFEGQQSSAISPKQDGAKLLGGLAATLPDARAALQRSLDSGAAAERFARMVAGLGGPADVLHHAGLAMAPVCCDVPAPRAGWLARLDVRALVAPAVASVWAWLKVWASIPAAMLVIIDSASTRSPAWRARMVSGTVLMPTAWAPKARSMRISAGVSNCGPITQA